MARIVQKFGGTSVADAGRLRTVANWIEKYARENQLVVVLSAQGKTTDRLVEKAEEIWPDGTGAAWARELDQLLACGEQVSVALCALELLRRGVPAVSLTGWQAGLFTSPSHQDAWPRQLITQRIEKELSAGKVVLITGFQGINIAGDITTLGRGGSDTTAVALSHYLGADRCQIFTDVDGVYTADPRTDPTARKLDTVSYDQMLHMARSGAKVLHDRCVKLAMEFHMPIEVRSTFSDAPGTIVGDA